MVLPPALTRACGEPRGQATGSVVLRGGVRLGARSTERGDARSRYFTVRGARLYAGATSASEALDQTRHLGQLGPELRLEVEPQTALALWTGMATVRLPVADQGLVDAEEGSDVLHLKACRETGPPVVLPVQLRRGRGAAHGFLGWASGPVGVLQAIRAGGPPVDFIVRGAGRAVSARLGAFCDGRPAATRS